MTPTTRVEPGEERRNYRQNHVKKLRYEGIEAGERKGVRPKESYI